MHKTVLEAMEQEGKVVTYHPIYNYAFEPISHHLAHEIFKMPTSEQLSRGTFATIFNELIHETDQSAQLVVNIHGINKTTSHVTKDALANCKMFHAKALQQLLGLRLMNKIECSIMSPIANVTIGHHSLTVCQSKINDIPYDFATAQLTDRVVKRYRNILSDNATYNAIMNPKKLHNENDTIEESLKSIHHNLTNTAILACKEPQFRKHMLPLVVLLLKDYKENGVVRIPSTVLNPAIKEELKKEHVELQIVSANPLLIPNETGLFHHVPAINVSVKTATDALTVHSSWHYALTYLTFLASKATHSCEIL